ncbi:MAG: glycine--tRNA ligase [Chloroflexi bacterium]|nr:glycine--tRNA ligase [Chloroflexota bacterium]
MDDLQKIVALCKRRGFVFPSAEIYGGFSNTYDWGPLGVLLKNNVRDAWIRAHVQRRDDVDLLDAAIITSPSVWKASGHVDNFVDPLVECLGECRQRFRADHLENLEKCPTCGGKLSEPRNFNGMFQTQVGPVEDAGSVAYLRPETAQGQFVNFLNVATSMRRKLPFGIAQVGRSFRNEITPGNFVFRTREFEQMEIEFFVQPGTDDEWFEHWVDAREGWYLSLGLRTHNLRRFEVPDDERAFYSKRTIDLQYHFPFGKGWEELEGIANRTGYDLGQHEQASGERLRLFDDETKEHVLPYVVEPAAGLSRAALVFMVDAYEEQLLDAAKKDVRTVLHLHPALAPYKAAIFPLSKKPELLEVSRKIYADLRTEWMVVHDVASGIGKAYRRQDEIGTPYCITVDFQTLEDQAVTVRDRDTMQQVRMAIADLRSYFAGVLQF